MKKAAKILSLVLAFSMIASLFVGAIEAPSAFSQAATKAPTKKITKAPTKKPTATPIPNLGGFKCVLKTCKLGDEWNMPSTRSDYQSYKTALDAAQKKYNFTLVLQNTPASVVDSVTQAASSGTKICNILHGYGNDLGYLASKKFLVRLDNIKAAKGVDLNVFDRTLFFQPGVKAMKMKAGEYYTWSYASNHALPNCGIFTYFNKNLVAPTGMDIYSLVRKGQWNYTNFEKIAKAATKDTNGDGVPDIVGAWWTHPNQMQSFLVSNGSALTKYSNGKYLFTPDDPRVVAALDFIVKLVNTERVAGIRMPNYTKTSYLGLGVGGEWKDNYWTKGKLAMSIHNWYGICDTNPDSGFNAANVGFNWGVCPMPKGPSATSYITEIFDGRCYGIPATNTTTDLKKIAVVVKALSSFMNNDSWEAVVLSRIDQDKQAIEMMKSYIFPGLSFDMMNIQQAKVKVYNYSGYIPAACQDAIVRKYTAAQAMASIKRAGQTIYDQTINKK